MSLAKSIILSLVSFGAGVTLVGSQPSKPEATNVAMAKAAEDNASADAQRPTPTIARRSLDAIYEEPLVRQANALSVQNGGSGDGLALLINLKGALCAKSLGATSRGHHTYEVTCLETIGADERIRYAFNAVTGTVLTTERVS